MNEAAIAAVGLYAALNAGVLAWLTHATGRVRAKSGVWMGDGGVPHLVRVMRGHANAVESIPVTLVLLLIAALMGAPEYVLHLLGILFTAGRILHARHFISESAPGWQRSVGFGLGALATGLTALGVLGHALVTLFV